MTGEFRRLGATFASGGAAYERLRPGYPDPAVDWMLDGLPRGAAAADVGAGTGKLTAALVARGLDVVAVDPSADMLAQLRRVQTLLGTGEQTGLAERSVDLVTYAQSWHWVEPTLGVAELHRVLRPGGRAAWIWNFMDVREAWVAELADIWHTVAGDDALDAMRHAPDLDDTFTPLQSSTFDWVQPMSIDDLGALVTTRSYYLAASPQEQEQIRGAVARFLQTRWGSSEMVDLPYRTFCFRAHTPPTAVSEETQRR